MEKEDYCPRLNNCVEKRQYLCYIDGYKNCRFYEGKQTDPIKEKGLTKRVAEHLGNSDDLNLQRLKNASKTKTK